MDEAFLYFNEMLLEMTAIDGRMVADEAGFRLDIDQVQIETPIELCIVTNEAGNIEIGTVPPLYAVETSFQPVYHTIRFTTEKNER